MTFLILLYLGLCFWAGAIASKKGRSAAGFFFLALLLSPLIGLIAAACVIPYEPKAKVAS